MLGSIVDVVQAVAAVAGADLGLLEHVGKKVAETHDRQSTV